MSFKPGDRIKVKAIVVNNIRRDMEGTFVRKITVGEGKGKYLVSIGFTQITVDPAKVEKLEGDT